MRRVLMSMALAAAGASAFAQGGVYDPAPRSSLPQEQALIDALYGVHADSSPQNRLPAGFSIIYRVKDVNRCAPTVQPYLTAVQATTYVKATPPVPLNAHEIKELVAASDTVFVVNFKNGFQLPFMTRSTEERNALAQIVGALAEHCVKQPAVAAAVVPAVSRPDVSTGKYPPVNWTPATAKVAHQAIVDAFAARVRSNRSFEELSLVRDQGCVSYLNLHQRSRRGEIVPGEEVTLPPKDIPLALDWSKADAKPEMGGIDDAFVTLPKGIMTSDEVRRIFQYPSFDKETTMKVYSAATYLVGKCAPAVH